MINEIKTIVRNYLSNAKLCSLQTGTVTDGGVQVSDKLTIPNELILGNLINYTSPGDMVKLIRNHGGQEFYIVEIIGKVPVIKGSTITLSKDGHTYEYKVEDVSM